jgi:hypothetical protein
MNNEKPWADEPTPLCDEKTDYNILPTPPDFARDLERRLRHALKLVNSLRIDAQYDTDPGNEHPLDPELLEQRLSDIEEVLTP